VSEFIDDVAAAARLAANARGIALNVRIPQDRLTIEADQLILSAVLGNLLQNAFKFTRPHTTVTLSVSGSADRVIIDVQDECGGLPGAVDGEKLSPRSRSKAPTGPAWASGSRSADGAPKQTVAGSTRATSLRGDAYLPWTFRGPQLRPSRALRLDVCRAGVASFRIPAKKRASRGQ
jgi:hypothetical protein